jgi:predicted amidohydrolase
MPRRLCEVVARVKGIVGRDRDADKVRGGLSNSAVVAAEGRIKGVCRKMLLPKLRSVRREKRYFVPGEGPFVFALGRFLFGGEYLRGYLARENGPTAAQAEMGARALF